MIARREGGYILSFLQWLQFRGDLKFSLKQSLKISFSFLLNSFIFFLSFL